MLATSLVFLTPAGAIAALAVVLPLAGLALAGRREREGRRLLGLQPPPPSSRAMQVGTLVAVPLLLGLAAMQPAIRNTTKARVRTDAQVIYVIDTSRSMLASHGPTGQTRIERAKQAAIELRNELPQIPTGVATFTDRVLPDLLPSTDVGVFNSTVDEAVGIDRPPPTSYAETATDFDALTPLGTDNFFASSARRRVVVLLTDGESVAFKPGTIAQALATNPGIHLLLVHIGSQSEHIYDSGKLETQYRPNPQSGQLLETLAAATGGQVFGENDLGGVLHAEKAALGTGPTQVIGRTQTTKALAPFVILLALIPLILRLRVGWARTISSLRALRIGRLPSAAQAKWTRGRRSRGGYDQPAHHGT